MQKIKKKRSPLKGIGNLFLTTLIGGITIILPLAILVTIVRFTWNFIVGLLAPMRDLWKFIGGLDIWMMDLISLIVIITSFFFIGLFVRTRIGNNVFRSFEKNTLERVPLYNTLRDIVQQFLGKKESTFLQVVLVKVFNSHTLMTGFVTEIINEDLYTVFVPTGPNPTNGFIFHVQKEQLEFVDTKAEDAMRTIIGVGTGSTILFPQFKQDEPT